MDGKKPEWDGVSLSAFDGALDGLMVGVMKGLKSIFQLRWSEILIEGDRVTIDDNGDPTRIGDRTVRVAVKP